MTFLNGLKANTGGCCDGGRELRPRLGPARLAAVSVTGSLHGDAVTRRVQRSTHCACAQLVRVFWPLP